MYCDVPTKYISNIFLIFIVLGSLIWFHSAFIIQPRLFVRKRTFESSGVKPFSWDRIVQNLTAGLPKRFRANLGLFSGNNKCRVSNVIHQTWKTENIPNRYVNFISSWMRLNKDWKYSFTTNKMNREFISKKFPEFLEIYDGYHSDIQRADFVRYFLLYEYGGVYADVDFEALRPLEFANEERYSCVLGQEPYEHAHVLYDLRRLICNAIMISCRNHPFWLIVFQELIRRKGIKTVRATGPKMLTAALEKYESLLTEMDKKVRPFQNRPVLPGVHIPRPSRFYPFFDNSNLNHKRICAKINGSSSLRRRNACYNLQNNHFKNNKSDLIGAVAVHHWAHTWHRANEVSLTSKTIDAIVKEMGGDRVYNI